MIHSRKKGFTMNRHVISKEEERKNFEEFFGSYLEYPHSEEPIEETVSEQLASPEKENDESSIECVMQEKLRSYMRHENNASYKKHVCGIAKKRYLLAKKTKSKAVTKKQTVLKKALQIADKEQLLEIAA